MPVLVIVDPSGGEQQLTLALDEYILGRDAGASIQLDSPKISRRHARLFRRGKVFHIEDLRSANGVFVSGQRIETAVPLQPSSEIDIGDYRLYLVAGSHDQDTGSGITLRGEGPPIEGQRFALSPGTHDVGRGHECTIVINDTSVSRQHARLVVAGGKLVVEDLGSSNGTFVNDQPLRKQEVAPGDALRFGNIPVSVHANERGKAAFKIDRRFLLFGVAAIGLLVVALTIAVVIKHAGRGGDPNPLFAAYDSQIDRKMRDAERAENRQAWDEALTAYDEVLEQDPLHQGAREGQREVMTHLDQRRLQTAQDACERRDWAKCHNEAVEHLKRNPQSLGASSLVQEAEKQMRASGMTFVPFRR